MDLLWHDLCRTTVTWKAVTHRPFALLKDDLKRGLIGIDEAMIELADRDREREIATLLAERARLGMDAVVEALGANVDALIVLVCRSAGVKLNGYSAILRMRHRHGRGEGQSPSTLLRAYQNALEGV
jgi:hypothetical protein